MTPLRVNAELYGVVFEKNGTFWDKYETIMMLTNICSGKPREMWENIFKEPL